MLDKVTALAAADAVNVAIAAMVEDCPDLAASIADGSDDHRHRAEELKKIASDMIVLVAAVIVLARRYSD